MTVWFDMDGTIADLYGVDNWLEQIKTDNEKPFVIAKPLVDTTALEELMNGIQRKGHKIGIVTCLVGGATKNFNKKVIKAKKNWLEQNLKNVKFDKIVFLEYEDVKNQVNDGTDILFDDEDRHLEKWTGKAVKACYMMETMTKIVG